MLFEDVCILSRLGSYFFSGSSYPAEQFYKSGNYSAVTSAALQP